VQEMVDGLNQALQAANKRLQFLVHETTGRIYVKVIDRETEEVIREIPPEKILDLVGRIQELVGLLVDEKV
ncbi:MAG: flagellar protein FlaG, partial [Limnochordales bacterium]